MVIALIIAIPSGPSFTSALSRIAVIDGATPPVSSLRVLTIRDLAGRLSARRARRPKVSVEIITYNHAEFIRQTLDSVLNQKASFEWEVVIGDDCSTDATREILAAYAREYPDRIRLLLHSRPLGPQKLGLEGKNNLLVTYRACRGEYVALLEGDDYWTDDHKLEKQVRYLDMHPEYSLCCHKVAVEYSGARGLHWGTTIGPDSESVYSLEDFLRLDSKPEMATASMVFRRRALRKIPAWFDEAFNGDYALQVLLAEQGGVGFLPDSMAVHRKHEGGISRLYESDPVFCSAMLLRLLVTMDEHFKFRFRSILDPYIETEQRVADAAAVRALASREEHPEAVIRLALDEFVPHAGRVMPDRKDGAAIVTDAAAWAYGASVRLPTNAVGVEGDHAAYARVRARVEGATVGIGVLDRKGEYFLDRCSVEPAEAESEVRLGIPRLLDAGDLVVQTWASDDSATVHIECIDLVLFARSEPATS